MIDHRVYSWVIGMDYGTASYRAFLVNAQIGEKWPRKFMNSAAEGRGCSVIPHSSKRGNIPLTILKDKFEIDLVNDAMTIQYDNQDPIPLLQTVEGTYTHDQFNFNLTFEDGVLHFRQRGRTVRYMKE